MNPSYPRAGDPVAEFNQLIMEHVELQRELADARRALTEAQTAADDARQRYHAELTRRGDTVAELLVKLNDRTSQVRANAAALVETLNALKALRDLVMEGRVSNQQTFWPGEVFRALDAASDVFRKHGIPF